MDQSDFLSVSGLDSFNQYDSGLIDSDEDNSIDESTQSFQNKDLQINEETRKKINIDFKNKLEKFIPKLFTEVTLKNQEIYIVKKILEIVKIDQEVILKQCELKGYQKSSQKKSIRDGQIRNTEENAMDMLKHHMENGKKLIFYMHDNHYTPFYLFYNPFVIFIDTKMPKQMLDVLHQILRNIKSLYDYQKFKFDQKYLDLNVYFEKNTMVVFLSGGKIKFEIKAGKQDIDYYQNQVLTTYCYLNPEIKKVGAFLNYWAFQRRILGQHALSEFALHCMVIDFFISQSLVPNIFTEQYCFWSEQQIEDSKYISNLLCDQELSRKDVKVEINQKLEQFKDKYITEHIKSKNRDNDRKKITYHWMKYPNNKEELEKAKKQWEKKQNKQPFNLGYQISVFFHLWNQQSKYCKALSFSTEYDPKKEEIGLTIMDPLTKNQNLTPFLTYRNSEYKSSNMYLQVRNEFKRAYDLILKGDFKNLCDESNTI